MNANDIGYSIIQVTDQNKSSLVEMMSNMYNSEGCGICEKAGAEVFWFSPYSRCAHAKCVKQIEISESPINGKIDEIFKDSNNFCHHNNSHIKIIKAVRAACGNETILSYFEKNGEGALTALFNTIGKDALNDYVNSKL